MEHDPSVGTDRARPRSDTPARGHRLLAHTADAGLEAWAPDAGALFEEAALALSDISADIEPGTAATAREAVAIEAPDAEGLVFAWLNELIGLIDVRGAAITGASVALARLEDRPLVRATVRLAPFDGRRVRRRSDIKSATYHRLAVRRVRDGWSLVAYLDI